MSAFVAIPVRDRLDLTRPLVEELVRQDPRSVVTKYAGRGSLVCVYDNGSTDGTREWLGGTDVPMVDAAGKSLHEMWNHAAERAIDIEADLVLLNNDLVLDGKPDWIRRLTAPLGDGWDALCPNYDGRTDWRPIQPLRDICANRYDGTGGLAGFAFALSNRFLRSGYRFPTDAKWWFGDTDMVMTLEQQGRPYGMVMDCGVTHVGGGSQTAKDHDLAGQCLKDKEWFDAKWRTRCTTA